MKKPRFKILVVDDTESNRYAKVRALQQQHQFIIFQAATGASALAIVANNLPDLALLDVKLPDMSGLDVCRQIKSDAATRRTLVLQTSASFVKGEDQARGLEGGADAYLTEPAESVVLLATVNALLRMRQAEDEREAALEREKEARQSAESANRAKDEFMAIVSHELRTPLTAMQGWLTLMQSKKISAEQHEKGLRVIQRNVQAQATLIDDLLDVSRMISGKMILDFEFVSIGPLLESAVDVVRLSAQEKNIQLKLILPEEGLVWTDPNRLRQIVVNLLSNAVKFTGHNGQINVEGKLTEKAFSLTVVDSGKGISAELLPFIFDRFKQGDSSSTRQYGGLGLGLAIANQLIAMHNGHIKAESAGEGRGSTFTVDIPRMPEHDRSNESAKIRSHMLPGAGPVDAEALKGYHIVVIEDDRDSREFLTIMLEQYGASVDAAASVKDGLTAVAARIPNVVLSDLGIPDEDGYSFIRKLRALSRENGGLVPAIALTAFVRTEDRVRVLESGFQLHLSKPIDPVQLVGAITNLGKRPSDRTK